MSHSFSCACGEVKVEVNEGAECVFSAICHCTSCREVTGTAALWANGFLSDHVQVTGDVIAYTHEVNIRTSCASCGSFMFEPVPSMGITMLPASRMSHPTPPMAHVYVKSAVYPLPDDGVPRFEEMPPMG